MKKYYLHIFFVSIVFLMHFATVQPLWGNTPGDNNTDDSDDCPKNSNSSDSEKPGQPDKGKNEEKCCSCQKKNENKSANDGQSTASTENNSNKCDKNSSGNENDNNEKEDECENGPGNNSLDLTVPFGRVINEGAFTNGKLIIYKERPSLTVFSPQGLFFSHALNRRILYDMTSGVPEGYSRKVVIPDTSAKRIEYYFKTGESVGWPARTGSTTEERLYMLDASGVQTTSDPVYYDLVSGANSVIRFSAVDKTLVYFKTSNGRTLDWNSPGIRIDVIYDDAASLRQVWSGADGLADMVVTGDDSYEIRLYSPDSVGAKGTDGLYAVNTGAVPYTVWKIAKPSGYSDIDKVEVTKSVNSVAEV